MLCYIFFSYYRVFFCMLNNQGFPENPRLVLGLTGLSPRGGCPFRASLKTNARILSLPVVQKYIVQLLFEILVICLPCTYYVNHHT